MKPGNDCANKNSILNVVFHGAFLFIFYDGRVEVVAASNREHIVGAGQWLDERPCSPGTYFLTGVTNSQLPLSDLQQTTFAVVDLSNYNQSNQPPSVAVNLQEDSYYRFILPIPWRITPLAAMDTDNSIFVGSAKKDIQIKSLATVHALTYAANQFAGRPVQLEGISWLPRKSPYQSSTSGCSYGFATNLHVYAESAVVTDPNHALDHFGQMVGMLPGLHLGLADRVDNPEISQPRDNDDLGLIAQEQQGLRSLPYSGNIIPDVERRNRFSPPLVCDAPSLFVLSASDPVP